MRDRRSGASLAHGGDFVTTYVHRRAARVAVRAPGTVSTHLAWLGGGLALGFLVPYLLADLLELPKDLYYGLYSAFAIGLFLVWARSTGQSLGRMLRRR
jgi:hypothetical protein